MASLGEKLTASETGHDGKSLLNIIEYHNKDIGDGWKVAVSIGGKTQTCRLILDKSGEYKKLGDPQACALLESNLAQLIGNPVNGPSVGTKLIENGGQQ